MCLSWIWQPPTACFSLISESFIHSRNAVISNICILLPFPSLACYPSLLFIEEEEHRNVFIVNVKCQTVKLTTGALIGNCNCFWWTSFKDRPNVPLCETVWNILGGYILNFQSFLKLQPQGCGCVVRHQSNVIWEIDCWRFLHPQVIIATWQVPKDTKQCASLLVFS